MAKNYHYGVYPFVYWCLNHYFLDGKHQIWVSAPFLNPLSPEATAYNRYGNLLKHVVQKQESGIAEWREFLQKEVTAQINTSDLQERLLRLSQTLSITFFSPLVYRVDIDTLPLGLAMKGDSEGQVGAQHFQIRALEESYFDILFADFHHEDMLKLWRSVPNAQSALDILESQS